MDKDQIRSKIEKEIKLGKIELFISGTSEYLPLAYAVLKPIWEIAKIDNKLFAIRSDQKQDEEFTRETVIDAFIDTIFNGIEDGKIEAAPIWFRSLVEYPNG